MVFLFCLQRYLAHLFLRQKSDRKVVFFTKHVVFNFVENRHLAATASLWSLKHLAELNKLLDLLAALDSFECLLAGGGSRFWTSEMAAVTHSRNKTRALYALTKTADQIDRRLTVVFLHFCLNNHVLRDYTTRVLLAQLFKKAGKLAYRDDRL